jgi:hypothetical protein
MTVLLVGEMPPATWARSEDYRRCHSPMFPYPRHSAGGRLLKISGLGLGEYVHGLTRINLVPDYRAKWPLRIDAEDLAHAALDRFAPVAHAFLCGRRVVAAFRRFLPSDYKPWPVDSIHVSTTRGDLTLHCIPHPSGRNLAYNDRVTLAKVREMFRKVQPLLTDWESMAGHNERRLVHAGH